MHYATYDNCEGFRPIGLPSALLLSQQRSLFVMLKSLPQHFSTFLINRKRHRFATAISRRSTAPPPTGGAKPRGVNQWAHVDQKLSIRRHKRSNDGHGKSGRAGASERTACAPAGQSRRLTRWANGRLRSSACPTSAWIFTTRKISRTGRTESPAERIVCRWRLTTALSAGGRIICKRIYLLVRRAG